MDKVIKHLVDRCREQFSYYDIVDENFEMVDYGSIIEFLFEQIANCELVVKFEQLDNLLIDELKKSHMLVCHEDHRKDPVYAAGGCYCGECKHWEKAHSSLIGEVMCCTGQGSVYIQKGADDFCSRGERRADNGEM